MFRKKYRKNEINNKNNVIYLELNNVILKL